MKLPRVDIQALRGLAVLMVVLYHAKIGGLEAGYLGVDIFFVISGFLITTLVASGLSRGTFRLSNFYFRRAKRLLPAAYVTFLVTALLAPWFLNQQELKDFAIQIVGAVTFTGNFVLWQQTGYFHGAGDLKPLLHVWSLAIEEQYYFLLPATLLFARPSRWLPGAIAVVLISLGLCIFGGMWKPIATFYLLPTRAWELLIGSVGALWLLRTNLLERTKETVIVQMLFAPALVCLLVLPVVPFAGTHPGLNAFLICLATVVVILRNSPWLNSLFPTKLLALIGDFSYSLYLVHWPIFAFLKNAWFGNSPELPINLRLTALALSFVAAYLLYRLVEDPIRRGNFGVSTPLIGSVVLSSLILASITPIVMHEQIDFKEAQKGNYGFSDACEYTTRFVRKTECENNANPSLLVWGDSYAMHLIPGLAQEWGGGGVIQATRSQCGPFLGLAHRKINQSEVGPVIDLAWAERCIGFNQSVLDFLRTAPSIKTVVLSSPFTPYVTKKGFEHVIQRGDVFESLPVNTATARSNLRRTVEEIRALGKKVVLIAPPPATGFNMSGCLERQIRGMVLLGGRSSCEIDRAEYESKQVEVLSFLNLISLDADVSVIRFDPWLCGPETCKTLLDGTMIYRDAGHLSFAGSKLLAHRMQIARLIHEQSR